MRFTSNALIVSTVALLSLITPVVNAADSYVANITTPTSGQKLHRFETIEVIWNIPFSARELDGVECNIALQDPSPSAPKSPMILQSGVLVESGQSTLQVPNLAPKDRKDYIMQLLSADSKTVLGKSGIFMID